MQEEIIKLEEYSKEGKPVPSGRRYEIRIDKDNYVVDRECMTGRELLELAKKVPYTKFQINQKTRGAVVKIGYDEKVCFTDPGIERFMTIPIDGTEG